MSNFYHKTTVASIGIALSFALGANQEAKAATFALDSTIFFEVIDIATSDPFSYDGVYDRAVGDTLRIESNFFFGKLSNAERTLFSEFNIDMFSLAPNKVIRSAIFQTQILSFNYSPTEPMNPGNVGIFGYVGNGIAEGSDLEAGVFLSSVDVSSSVPGDIVSFDVTPFVEQRVSNADAFAGFALRALNPGFVNLGRSPQGGGNFPSYKPLTLVIETADVAEPVPEPTTIFGSAIGLCLGGWLKRKKSNLQNKTTSQS
jgi:hypothetical protein